MRLLLTLVSLLVQLFAFNRWFSCWHFTDIFYYTPSILIGRVIGGINNDYGVPPIITHLMHNKATYFIWGGLQTVMEYWETRFLKEFIGIIGVVGIYFALWYLFTKHRRNRYVWLLFILCIIIACIEIFIDPHTDFLWKLLLLGIPYQLFSLFGIWQFLGKKTKLRYFFIIIVLVISIGTLLTFPLAYQIFCLKK